MKRVLECLAFLAIAFTPGCIDMTEILTVEADGSGSIEVTYSIPIAMFRGDKNYSSLGTDEAIFEALQKEVETQAKQLKGFTVEDVTVERADEEFLPITIAASFESLDAFSNITRVTATEPGSGDPAGGKKEVPGFLPRKASLEEKDGHLVFRQEVRVSNEEKKEGKEEMDAQMAGMMKSAYAGHRLNFTVVLPGNVASADGASIEENAATWEYKLAETVDRSQLGPMEASLNE